MLDLGKLAAGAENYYLGTVASGVEDYYVGSGEAPGYWTGEASKRFDLDGTISAGDLRAVLAGRDPRSGERLGATRGRPRTVPGWDATFRAPKSVTLLWALSDPEITEEVRQAHDEAVAQALGYLECNAAMVRRGGEQVAAEGFVAAAFRHRTSRAGDPLLHTHVLLANHARTADDGRWRALDARALYSHARTAGFVYQAALRQELVVRLGVAFEPVTNGYADLAGMPRELIELFSTRRSEILELLEERAEASAKSAQVATLATRRAKSKPVPDAVLPAPGSKDYGVEPGTLQQDWIARAEPLGWTRERMRTLLHAVRRDPLGPAQAAEIAGGLLGASGLTAHKPAFTRRDVVRGWAESLRQGASAVRLEALADAVLADDAAATLRLKDAEELAPDADRAVLAATVDGLARRLEPQVAAEVRASAPLRANVARALADGLEPAQVVAALLERELASAEDVAGVLVWRARRLAAGLDGGSHLPSGEQGRSVIRREDGQAVAAQPGEARYSTPEMVALERRAIDLAVARQHAGVAIAEESALAAALARRPLLAGEQADMVRRLTRSGSGVEVVVGKAGAGKTTALAAARDAWEASGTSVVGAALAARAARELQTGAGIDSSTVQQLLNDAERSGQGLRPGSVLVIDEAAMVGTRQLARLLEVAAGASAKVVLVGDHHQLPEIDAGGLFRGLQSRLPSIELTVNRRQRHPWERRALDLLRTGEVEESFDAFREAGRVTTGRNADHTRDRLVQDWWDAATDAADPTAHGFMLAVRRTDVDDLNARARQRLERDGLLGPVAVNVAGREFAVGDAAVCNRNARRLRVDNGTRGHVVAVDPESATATLTMQLADGSNRQLTRSYLDGGGLSYGYALTGHRAQGQTVDRAWVLGSDLLYQEWAYTALSRHRETVQLYVVGETEPPDWVEHPETLAIDGRSPVEQMIRAAKTSRAQMLAVDQGEVATRDREPGVVPARLRTRLRTALRSTAQPTQRADAISAAPADTLASNLGRPFSSAVEQALPSYLTAALGHCPYPPDELKAWQKGASAIERYRLRWSIDDVERPLGPLPSDPHQAADYRAAAATLRGIQRRLGVGPAGHQLDLAI